MTTATAARPDHTRSSSHWYSLTGEACHTVKKKDGSGDRPTTLADARKLNLLPSVTGIIDIVDKPALTAWRVEQGALAVLTAPRKPDEGLDAFVKRVLQDERQQEQESDIAKKRGTEIHDAIEGFFHGLPVPEELEQWVRPVLNRLLEYGEKASAEVVLVGDDYAGCTDLLQDCAEWWRLWDFKTTKNLPDPAKGAWLEHQLQLSAYGKAFKRKLERAGHVRPILVGNIYISTINPGQFVAIETEGWEDIYEQGFVPLVKYWQFAKNYWPVNPNRQAAQASADVVTHYQVENGKLKQELEDLRAKLAVAQKNANVTTPPTPAMIEGLKEALGPEIPPEKDPGEPMVVPASVQELKKAGKRVAWSTSSAQPAQAAAAPLPAPIPTGPGRPSPLIEKAPPLPPGVIPRTLVNGPNGPVMQ